jgi:hypothetical protein
MVTGLQGWGPGETRGRAETEVVFVTAVLPFFFGHGGGIDEMHPFSSPPARPPFCRSRFSRSRAPTSMKWACALPTS